MLFWEYKVRLRIPSVAIHVPIFEGKLVELAMVLSLSVYVIGVEVYEVVGGVDSPCCIADSETELARFPMTRDGRALCMRRRRDHPGRRWSLPNGRLSVRTCIGRLFYAV